MRTILYYILFIIPTVVSGQNNKADTLLNVNQSFTYNVDMVSRYLWRGLMLSSSPNLQPYATYSIGNLSIGTWASYAVADKYAEVDFSLYYAIKNFTLSVNDYYTEDETDLKKFNYFEFTSKRTNHALEGALLYTFSGGVPLSISAATFFYGNDRDTSGNNNYSTYIEMTYKFKFSGYDFNLFIGGTTGAGYYATEASIVNAGISFSRLFSINDKISLPLSASLVTNPKAEDIFLVFKLTL